MNNLASKLLMALLPANQSIFRLTIDDFTLEELTGKPDARAEIEKALGKIERAVGTEIEATAVRPSIFEAFKQLITVGNALLYVLPEGGVKVFKLDNYVVKRDPSGNVIEIVVKEQVSPLVLPEKTKRLLKDKGERESADGTVDIYTWIRRKRGKFSVHQEVKGELVPGTKGTYPVEKTPWIPLRWVKIDGEDYGRSHVEEYIGDLRSLEGLTKAIVEGSAAAAKVLFLVDPNGITSERTIANAPPSAVRSGNAKDVSVLQVDKYADFRVALETVNRLEQRLAQAFLLTASVTRQAERVTAEEIRLIAGELEDALGGVYSVQSAEFQLPFVRRLMFQMEQQGRLPSLPPDTVRPSIVAGMNALGRGHDLNRLMTFSQTARQAVGDETFAEAVRGHDFITRIGTSLSIDMDGLMRTEKEIAEGRRQNSQARLMEQLGPEAMRQAGQQQITAQQKGAS
ncbi:hypothetical protein ABID12_003082 [Martelella mangrovi]|uniref:Phage tail protein n=1 Tax=Martelella mangrovi TaxID=1397477 RepID=A0ABV2IDY6_9HYPH